jgi:GTPase SAR1 family protein
MVRANRDLPGLAERLLRPQRVGVFGHRGVGKTTLLSVLYREASAGRLEGCRLAAADAATAEYLADKIHQLEKGQVVPGTLAETDLRLNLYQNSTRIELVFKDYQGEHVELGRDEPIHQFLRDCDAVWLCADASALSEDGMLRRQQEFEQLVESYLAKESGAATIRPFALLLTKADLLQEDPDESLAMTRHALDSHCPNSELFAVSSLERDGEVFRLAPRNLDPALGWLATALEGQDEARLERLWTEHPRDLALMTRCVTAFARRYGAAPAVAVHEERLRHLRRRLFGRRSLVGAAAAACLAVGIFSYDALGRQAAERFEAENGDNAAAVLGEWEKFQQWHPTRNLLAPDSDRDERERVKRLEKEARRQAYVQRLADLRRRAGDVDTDVEALAQQFAAFRQEFTDGDPADLKSLQEVVERRRAEFRARRAKEAYDAILAAEHRAVDPEVLLTMADRFVAEHAGSAQEEPVRYHRADYRARIDVRDIEDARQYSRQYPLHFQTRRERFQRYLERHPSNGCFLKEAEAALVAIDSEWDRFDFRAIRDLFEQNPGDVPNLSARCRAYLGAHPRGQFVDSTRELLRWGERISTAQDYHVALKRGEFEKKIARFFSLGPDLSVEIEVKGVRYGPSNIVKNHYTPEWEYEFPRTIRWKLGDPVKIIVTDHDWKDRVVMTIESEEGDPVAMRLLSGEVASGPNRLRFESDFGMPVLPRIE